MKAGGKIALVGFPNAGKTTLFNALTGAHERTGNWHGVTVTARGGKMKKLPCFLYDLPGIYGEEATSPEEKVTREFLEREKDALLLIAVSANDAARGLAAAEHLIKTRKTLVVFTFYDEFSTRGGKIDIAALNAKCFAAAAVDGNDKQDVKRLETALRRALEGGTARKDFRLEEAEKLIIVPPQKKNFLDKVLFHKAGALTAFALLFAFVFYAAFGKYSPSMLLTDLIGNLGKRAADGARAALSAAPPWFSGFLCDGVLTGIFAVLGFLPQLVTLFLFLTVLEESGIMARFAFMSDGLFEKIGLNGRAFFSLFAGFGCTAVAALSTRSLDDKTLHKKTVLMLPFISCSARLPVYAIIINAVFPFAKPVLLMAIYLLGVSLACVRALRQGMRQKFAAAFDGNARFKKSAVKKTRKILALLFKTIYNKSRQSDPLRHAGDVVFEQFFLYASIYRRGKRHARRARKGIKIPVLPDGNNRLAGFLPRKPWRVRSPCSSAATPRKRSHRNPRSPFSRLRRSIRPVFPPSRQSAGRSGSKALCSQGAEVFSSGFSQDILRFFSRRTSPRSRRLPFCLRLSDC